MPTLNDLVERIEHLLVRHQELERTHELLRQEVEHLGAERDALRSKLGQARARIDSLLERIPVTETPKRPEAQA